MSTPATATGITRSVVPSGNVPESSQPHFKLLCPRCGSDWTYRSGRIGIFEKRVLRLLQFSPYRCDSCNRRFYHRSSHKPSA
jgi:transposase-like protein